MRLAAIFLSFVLGAAGFAQVAYDTKRFDVDVAISQNRSVEITEKISVDFREERRGLVRTIPHVIQGKDAKRRVGYTFLEFTANGKTVPASSDDDGNQYTLKIGDPNLRVIGDVTYTIRYRVTGALTNIDKNDAWGPRVEFFWNLLPIGWPTPIEASKITLTYPEPASKGIAARVLFGPRGSRAGIELAEDKPVVGRTDLLSPRFVGNTTFEVETRRRLEKGFGITVVLGLPKGTLLGRDDAIIETPLVDREPETLTYDSFPNNPIGLFLPVIPGAAFLWWTLKNRPKKPGPLVVRFDPPSGVDPMRAGVLYDDKFQPRDVLAGIVSVAQQGACTLKVEDKSFALHFTGRQPATLSDPEKRLLDELRPFGPDITPEGLRNSFSASFRTLDAVVRNQLIADGWRKQSGNAGWGCLAFFLFLAATVGSCMLGGIWGCAGLILGGVVLAIGLASGSPWTDHGAFKKWELDGLKEFIVRAHKDPLEFAAKYHPTTAMYEKLLPYAIGFGLVQEWSKSFAGIDLEQPTWIDSGGDTMLWYWMFSDGWGGVDNDWSSAVSDSSGGGWGGGDSGFGGGFSSGGGFDGGGGFDSGGSVGDGGGGGGGGDW
jgi:hypothetical protein